MKTDRKENENINDQHIDMDEGFRGGDGYPDCDGEACANMADMEDNSADQEAECDRDENNPAYQAALWKEKYMRLSAEYDNYRKRTIKEKLDIASAGGEEVVRSMLEVLDDMDRALVAIASTEDMEAVKQGIILIDNKLRGALRSRGLAEIEAVGSELDTDLHEAIARIEVEEAKMKGRVVDVVQKGYKLRDKIIRYAKVVVGQ